MSIQTFKYSFVSIHSYYYNLRLHREIFPDQMSSNTEEVQKLLGEKKQLEKEEKILEAVIDLIKRQMSALQVRDTLMIASNTWIFSLG